MPLLVLLVFLVLPQVVAAQRSAELGITGGGMWYNGELNPNKQFYRMSPAGGLIFRHNFNYRYSLRLTGIHGSIKGDDRSFGVPFQTQRGLAFQSPVTELAAGIEFNFLPYEIGGGAKFRFTSYVFGGLGVFRFAPRAGGPGSADLQASFNEPGKKYSLIQPNIPFGFGFKFNFIERIGIFMEWGMRRTFTDYLDDVSTTWGDKTRSQLTGNELVSNPLTGFQRGYSTNKDWYSYAGIGLVYLMKKKRICPAYNRGL